jgi:hypothetical protein
MASNTVQYRCVYELIDPRNSEVFYVGQTNRPISRLCEHIISAIGVWQALAQEQYFLITDKEYRIAEIKKECGKYPEMKIVLDGQYTYSEICKLETQTIKIYASQGVLLTNTNSIMREKERIAQEARCEKYFFEWHNQHAT